MKLQVLLVACCLAAGIPAHASDPLQPIEVSDEELAQLRGRFVMPGLIVHFGVTMSSQWENAQGQVLGGRVGMQMSEGMFEPQFTASIVTRQGEQPPPAAGNGQVIGGEGLALVDGVSQSVRAAGDFNRASNDLTITVRRGEAASATNGGGQPLTGAIESMTSAGSVRISPSGGGLQIAIQAAGQGSSVQNLGNGGLQQHTNIGGSRNAVSNVTALEVVLRERSLSSDQVQINLGQVGALRPAGY
ncbi:hypothetical protein ACFPTX_00025 [Pseudomonas sp. GCM10022188]|uniref:hypothetical protein n=1 Tax=Pseudomonas TaxID=286 RepID=UPI001E2F9A0E|nr:hypothetical protein [Pseudomonas oryzagri]MCC6077390.1 hypothetical protein [Pseudomonas oryzagri]